jgi:hypothetical protein
LIVVDADIHQKKDDRLVSKMTYKLKHCKWIPHKLSEAQKQTRVTTLKCLLDLLRSIQPQGWKYFVTRDPKLSYSGESVLIIVCVAPWAGAVFARDNYPQFDPDFRAMQPFVYCIQHASSRIKIFRLGDSSPPLKEGGIRMVCGSPARSRC